MAIGKQLRAARIASKQRQDQACGGAGITGSGWSHYELGRTDPSIGKIIKLCGAIGADPVELITAAIREYQLDNERCETENV